MKRDIHRKLIHLTRDEVKAAVMEWMAREHPEVDLSGHLQVWPMAGDSLYFIGMRRTVRRTSGRDAP